MSMGMPSSPPKPVRPRVGDSKAQLEFEKASFLISWKGTIVMALGLIAFFVALCILSLMGI